MYKHEVMQSLRNDFDREVLQLVILSLQDLHEKLKPHHGTPQMNGGRVLEMIIGIRDN